MRVQASYGIKCSIVASILLLYVYPLFLSTPLLDPDEGLHASIALEMVESGDYLTPRSQGQPFLDKPILYFLMQALSLRCFGSSEAAVRLPGVLCALLGFATTYLLARRLFDKHTALLAVLVLSTMIVPVALAQAPIHDLALVPWTNLLVLCWWETAHTERRKLRAMLTLAAAVWIALALLTKGLIGVAIVSIGYFLFLATWRLLSLENIVSYMASFLTGCLLASPWFFAMETAAPGYLFYYFVERHVGGFATASQQHGGAAWHYYLPVLLGGAMPWTLHTLPGLLTDWCIPSDRAAESKRAPTFTLCWLVGGLIFLSIASSKLITYCLPLFPAIAMLAAHSVKLFFCRQLTPRIDSALSGLFQLSCAVGVFLPTAAILYLDQRNGVSSPPIAHFAGGLAALFSLFGLVLFRYDRRQPAVATGALWSALVFVALITWPLQTLAQSYSQREVGIELAKLDTLPEKVLFVDDRVGSALFYLTPAQRRELQSNQIATVSHEAVQRLDLQAENLMIVLKYESSSKRRDTHLDKWAHSRRQTDSHQILKFGARTAQLKERSR